MANAIFQLGSGRRVGRGRLGRRGARRGSIKQEVSDGDTVSVEAAGDFGVRFLGIDAPESKFPLPNHDGFISTGSAEWDAYLTDPLSSYPERTLATLGPGLRAHLAGATGAGSATNHNRHAKAAEDGLESAIEEDLAELGATNETFEFFLSFATEVMDGFGRLLCFVNRNQPDPNVPEPRPASYNERLVASALVSPYFIWPNINPFRRQPSILDAVPRPQDIGGVADDPNALGSVRAAVKTARGTGTNIYDPTDPLRLLAFELRFLGRRSLPSRWVLDLSCAIDVMLQPTSYWKIPNPEDRLFIPPQYVALFQSRGWRLESAVDQ